ncbi:alpha/beta hydrolase [Hymenobacter actinosclerus]|uniref:Alpha/beta hydrolase family protein n=1 Tax=Hymenobacter actinosclerus TaxID=82805 RepID=A0A1I0I0T5_9BACT|nr:alpha/beta hydrolase [Hymenobacter actinosclerus]SET89858.1 Alpha/beta hydrolase family protein [Hymenobacter actinosclerus]
MNKPIFYLIPGLGADERVFQRLQPLLHGPSRVLLWLPPEADDEPLAHYAARMAAAIPAEATGWLVGVSFGGVVALEMQRLRPGLRVVLISSLPDAQSLPPLLRLVRASGLYRLVPPQWLKLFPRAGQLYFGVRNGAEYRLFKRILLDMEPCYTRWAISRLLHWDSTGVAPAVQLLGTRDRVFPPGHRTIDYRIRGGGHFMVLSHAAEIAGILNELELGADMKK